MLNAFSIDNDYVRIQHDEVAVFEMDIDAMNIQWMFNWK